MVLLLYGLFRGLSKNHQNLPYFPLIYRYKVAREILSILQISLIGLVLSAYNACAIDTFFDVSTAFGLPLWPLALARGGLSVRIKSGLRTPFGLKWPSGAGRQLWLYSF